MNYFSDPSERLYWLYLLSAVLISLAVSARFLFIHLRSQQNTKQLFKRTNLTNLLKEAFQLNTWLHPSAMVDYQLLLFKGILRVIFAGKLLVSAFMLAHLIASGLMVHLGSFKPPSFFSPTLVSLIYTVVLFVCWDFSRYVLHRLLHKVPFLWELHKVHHSAEVLTPVTLYRTHPLEAFLFFLRGVLVTGIITGCFFYIFQEKAVSYQFFGVNIFGFLFSLAGSNLRHSHIWLSFGRLENFLISPAQHQIHHSSSPEHLNKNFGAWLSVWDQLSGSLVLAEKNQRDFRFGVDKKELNHDPHSLVSVLYKPLVSSLRIGFRSLFKGRQLVAKVMFLFFIQLFFVTNILPQSLPKASGKKQPDLEISQKQNTRSTDTVQRKEEEKKTGDSQDAGSSEIDISLDTISIMGDSRVVGSAHSIEEEELDRFESSDVHRVLKQVPGAYVRGEDGYGLRPNIGLRGANSDRSSKVTLMEDGVLLAPAPYSAPAAYYFPIFSRISKVEVFKGPASIRYGPNTIGGAINFVTRPMPKGYAAYIDSTGGSQSTFRGHAYTGAGFKNFQFLVEAGHLQSNGFKFLDGGGNTGFRKSEVLAKARFQLAPKKKIHQQVDFRFVYADERSNETYLGLTDTDFQKNPYRRYAASQLDLLTWGRFQGRVDYLLAYKKVFDLRLNIYRHDLSRTWRRLNGFRDDRSLESILENPTSGQSQVYYEILTGQENSANDLQNLLLASNARAYVSQGAQLTNRVMLPIGTLDQEIEIGLRYHNDHIERDHTSDDYEMSSGQLRRTERATERTTNNRGLAHAVATHVHDKITFGDFLVAPGLRVEYVRTEFTNYLSNRSQNNDNLAVLPGVGAHYQPADWVGILIGVHRGFSPVSPGQSAEVRPETSINYEGGGRFSYKKSKWEVIGYYSDYSNLTGECTFSAGCQENQLNNQFNAGSVDVYGVETIFEQGFSLPFDIELTAKALYTLTLSRFRTNFSSSNPQFGDVRIGYELPYLPRHQFTILTHLIWKSFSLDVSISYISPMRNIAGSGEIPTKDLIGDQFVVDLAGSYEVITNASVYFTIKNLFDNAYLISKRPFGARPGHPFNIVAGAKYLWET